MQALLHKTPARSVSCGDGIAIGGGALQDDIDHTPMTTQLLSSTEHDVTIKITNTTVSAETGNAYAICLS